MNLDALNEKQKEAVTTTEGPLLVLAGAGSGKTRVLTTRIVYLIEELGIDPHNILAITFTNKAAKEMKERIIKMLGSVGYQIQISTFHSFGLLIVKENYPVLGFKENFTILDGDDSLTIIKKIMKDMGLDIKEYNPKAIRNQISGAKNQLLSAEQYERYANTDFEEKVVSVYRRYQERLRTNNSLDFDDLLMLPNILFKTHPEILERYQDRFHYILVDEYQDTNESQYSMVKLIGQKHQNVCVVGDNDQCLLPSTKIVTNHGIKCISEVNKQDLVLSGVGKSETDYSAIDQLGKRPYEGPIIHLETISGKTIDATPEHKIFFELGLHENLYYVYLMYKKEYGFRIGMTSAVRHSIRGESLNGLQLRLNGEMADKIWIVKLCHSKEEAVYYEEYYSSLYGLPRTVFTARGRKISLSQDKIESLFEQLPTREHAISLMHDEHLYFEYPHYNAGAVIRGKYSRKIINLTYLSGRKTNNRNFYSSRISIHTSGMETKENLEKAGYKVRKSKGNTYRIETERIYPDELKEYIDPITDYISDFEIVEKIQLIQNDNMRFLPIGSIREGMKICIWNGKEISKEEVTSVTMVPYSGDVYDLSIPTTRNYVANDIFVHNCIYSWRGSNYRNILNFEKDYPKAKTILLEENYRSTKTILNAANDVIKNNRERKDKKLWTNNEEGVKIKYHKASDEKEEAYYVMNEIKTLIEKGIPKNEIAILYRTNAQSRNMEEALLRENVPYKVVGSFYFYNRKEIKDLIAYLKLIYNQDDDVNLLRIINTPKRGIGMRTLETLQHRADIEGKSLFEAIETGKEMEFKRIIEKLIALKENSSLTELVDYVLDLSGIRKELESEKTIEADVRLENLEEFKSITKNFEEQNGIVSLEEFLMEISLVSDIEEHKNNTDVVTLMTVHSAKGLEFDYVFIIGLEEGIFPHSNSMLDNEGLEEERRLCYVAITRARKALWLLNARKRTLFGQDNYNPSSRFIGEIEETYLEKDQIEVESEKKNIFTKKETMVDPNAEYNIGDAIMHDTFGRGVVVGIEKSILTIAFPHPHGIKKLIKGHKSIRKV